VSRTQGVTKRPEWVEQFDTNRRKKNHANTVFYE